MTGANYMGGKRNAVRARTRDAAYRAQKRHFVNQRLVSALGKSSRDRHDSRAPRLPSILPKLSLAHAHHQGMAQASSPQVPRPPHKQLLSSSPDSEKRRKQPPKVLPALDTSDHMSIRAAIGRILQLPDLVGVRTRPQPAQTIVAAHDTLDRQEVHGQDLHAHHSGSQRAGDRIPRDLNLGPMQTSRSSSYSEIGDAEDIFSYAPPSDRSKWAQNHHYSPLPRSSPLPSDFRHTDSDIILDFDSSQRTPPSPITAWSEDYSPMAPHDLYPATGCCSPGRSDLGIQTQRDTYSGTSHVSRDYSSDSSSRVSMSPSPLEPISQKKTFPDFFLPLNAKIHPQELPVRNMYHMTTSPDIPLDFIADPDPWATIGNILQLQHAHDASSTCERPISFTRYREGVGHTFRSESIAPDPVSPSVNVSRRSDRVGSIQRSACGPSPSRGLTAAALSYGSDSESSVCGEVPDIDVFSHHPRLSGHHIGVSSPSRSSTTCSTRFDIEDDNHVSETKTLHSGTSEGQVDRLDRGGPRETLLDNDMILDGPCLFGGDSDLENE